MLAGVTDLGGVLDRALRVDVVGMVLRVDRAADRGPVVLGLVGWVGAADGRACRTRWAETVAGGLRAAVGEAGLEDKGFAHVGGKGLADRVDLFAHLGHGPAVDTLFKEPHVSGKVLAAVDVEFGVRRG